MNNIATDKSRLQADDLLRSNVIARLDSKDSLRHVSVVGDTYTILLDAKQTDNHYCVIDMLIPQHGGPPPHRHDFEETFIVLEGEIDATFRGQTSTVKAGETLHIPANAPHRFTNTVPSRPGSCASVLLRGRRSSFSQSATLCLPARHDLRRWMKLVRRLEWKRRFRSLPNTALRY